MDPALKKRLIGASVLIVLAIIFLPMLFDGTGKPVAGDSVQLDIPDLPQRDFETRVVPLDVPPAASGNSATPSLATAIDAPPPVGADTSMTTAVAPIDEPIATIAAPVETRVDAVSGDTVSVPSAPAQATSATPQPQPAAAVVAAPAVVSAAVPVSANGRFMVNIGSYANAANAAQLESSLRAAGLTVRSDAVNFDGKSAQRLRLGPYASRALAENARLKAKSVRADLPASVVEIDDTPTTDVPARNPARASASAFAVQIAVLSDVAKANARRDDLRKAGFAAFVEKLETAKGPMYRLRIGPEAARSDAEKVKAAVKQRFGDDAIIVDYP